MAAVQTLRCLVTLRQSAAAEEILELFKRSLAENRDLCYSTENNGHKRQAAASLGPEVHQLIVGEPVPCEQQKWRTTLDQEDPDPPHIKEEREEFRCGHEGEQLQGPEEEDVNKFPCPEADEDCRGLEPARRLRVLVKQRLTAAVVDIFGMFETTLAEYEKEIEGLHKLLEGSLTVDEEINTSDDPQLLVVKEEGSSEQREWRSSLDQEDPEAPHIKEDQEDPEPPHIKEEQEDPEPPHIKEDQEELWTSQEGDQLQGLEETGIKFSFTPVKSEDDEEEAQSSQLHQRQTEQMETEDDGEDCGGPELDRISDPHLQPVNEDDFQDSSETDDSDWSQTNEARLGVEAQKHTEVSECNIGSSAKERLFPCSYCGKSFGQKRNLNRHIRDHTGERPFPCTGCDKTFKDRGSLTAHMRCHTGEQPYSCLFCGKNFSGRGNMTRHMKIHTGEKPFTCLVCSKSFHLKEHLNRHMKYHTGEKPFSCSICGKGFVQKTDLKKHMRVHTGEKPFSCPSCGKRCAEKGCLTKHMRLHMGKKPFICNVCGKRCAQKGSLKSHMRVHRGEKPFSCTVCGKCFTVTGHLKRHMKLHTAGGGGGADIQRPETRSQVRSSTSMAAKV